MNTILYIVLFICFGITAYQDVSSRLIHFMLPIAIMIIAIIIFWKYLTLNEVVKSLLFLIANFSIITLYFSIKNKRIVNPFNSLIGYGDLLFLIAVIPFFSFRNYVLFFVSGMLFSLMLFVFFKKSYKKEQTVPLAGYLSIFLVVLLSVNFLVEQNIFFDFIF